MDDSASFCLVFLLFHEFTFILITWLLFKAINVTFMFRMFFFQSLADSIYFYTFFIYLQFYSVIRWKSEIHWRCFLLVLFWVGSFEFQCHREHFFIFILWPILINYWFVCSTSQYIIATFTNGNCLLSILIPFFFAKFAHYMIDTFIFYVRIVLIDYCIYPVYNLIGSYKIILCFY